MKNKDYLVRFKYQTNFGGWNIPHELSKIIEAPTPQKAIESLESDMCGESKRYQDFDLIDIHEI